MKILKLLFILLLFIIHYTLFFSPVRASNAPVYDIFSDINSDYKYIDELQTLYDKWMIIPDENGRFNPHALLTREEFVWILTEVTCKKCIQPNTSYDLISQYENSNLFFDITKENKYFYCIADASKNNYVSWYHEWTTCNDGTYRELERPFCPNNNIILEEAIAIILRASGILSNTDAEQIRQEIRNGVITEYLSDDVWPKNLDWSVYSFYPDFKKALEYEVLDIDTNWNENILKLVEINDGKIRPKQSISKEDFLKIAYVTLKANSCIDSWTNSWNLALSIDIYNKSCSETQTNCSKSYLNDSQNTYDFSSNVITECSAWVSNPSWYIWRFFNSITNEEIKKYWKYIDNYEFLSDWNWIVYHRVVDKCNNTIEVYNTINISNNDIIDDLKVSIVANPISGVWPLKVDFEAIYSWWDWPYSITWDYWDGNWWFWYKWQNVYKNNWSYIVELTIENSNWNISKATMIINVVDENQDTDGDWVDDGVDNCVTVQWPVDNNGCPLNQDTDGDWVDDRVDNCVTVQWPVDNNGCPDNPDSDNDGIIDSNDLCPLIIGDSNNWGCPILEKACITQSECNSNQTCNWGYCKTNILSNSCEYSWSEAIIWNIVCNSCPCAYDLDFNSRLRKCDILFPAITSPDFKEVYSKWNYFQIK